eukprot:5424726-Alexandrium_andersonii.AAC.1
MIRSSAIRSCASLGGDPYSLRSPQPGIFTLQGAPKCNPEFAQFPSGLQSASIRNPPCLKCTIAARVRTWNCAGPGTAS